MSIIFRSIKANITFLFVPWFYFWFCDTNYTLDIPTQGVKSCHTVTKNTMEENGVGVNFSYHLDKEIKVYTDIMLYPELE